MNNTILRFLLPETLWLEPEHYDIAKQQSQQSAITASESDQWQCYINSLAQLSFQDWLSERFPDVSISEDSSQSRAARFLSADDFRLCLVATEQVLDESISIPRSVVDTPELAAHYYVAVEVLEEEQQAIIRGFLSYGELAKYAGKISANATADIADYSLPLSALNAEPNHLISYIQRLVPSAIVLPAASTSHARTAQVSAQISTQASSIVAKLSDWLDETITASWQAIDDLVNPQMALAVATRSSSTATKAGKLINLGVQLGNRSVALVVTVVPVSAEPDSEKLSVLVQLLPMGDYQQLPEQIKLSLLSSKGNLLQEVVSRAHDNYIQLRSFKGKRGTRFSVEVVIADVKVSEAFEL